MYFHSPVLLTCASETKAVSEIFLLLTPSALHGNLPAQGRAGPKPKPSFPSPHGSVSVAVARPEASGGLLPGEEI